MERQDYERLINRGFRIIRENNRRIEIKATSGEWSYLCDYTPEVWSELIQNEKTLNDY